MSAESDLVQNLQVLIDRYGARGVIRTIKQLGGKVDQERLYSTTDAQIWAEEFAKVEPEVDSNLMIGWFANAIETAKREAKTQTLKVNQGLNNRIGDSISWAHQFCSNPKFNPKKREPVVCGKCAACKTAELLYELRMTLDKSE